MGSTCAFEQLAPVQAQRSRRIVAHLIVFRVAALSWQSIPSIPRGCAPAQRFRSRELSARFPLVFAPAGRAGHFRMGPFGIFRSAPWAIVALFCGQEGVFRPGLVRSESCSLLGCQARPGGPRRREKRVRRAERGSPPGSGRAHWPDSGQRAERRCDGGRPAEGCESRRRRKG